MWRVETVGMMKRGQPEVEDVLSELDRGNPYAVSMGCRIPFDICSLCGNMARTSNQHCDHLKTMLKSVMPNGIVVGMINYYPLFFDQSFVRKGADPSAWAHRKVAEGPAIVNESAVKTAELAIELTSPGFQKAAAESDKAAAMYKEVPGGMATHQVGAEHGQTIRSFLKQVRPKLKGKEEPMPKKLQAKIASDYSMSQIWSTLHFAGIDLRPDEFQYMALRQAGHDKLAEHLHEQGITFDPVEPDDTKYAAADLSIDTRHIDHKLFDQIAEKGVLEKRSCWRPFLMLRVADMCKEAAMPMLESMSQPAYPETIYEGPPSKDGGLVPILLALAGAYTLARKQLSKMTPASLSRWIDSDPRGTPMALSSVSALDQAKVRRAMDKDLMSAVAIPGVALVGAESLRDISQAMGPRTQGEIYWEDPKIKTADVKGFLGRSLIGVPLAYGLAGYQDAKEQAGLPQGMVGNFVQDHPIGLGMAGALAYPYAKDKLMGPSKPKPAGASATKQQASDLWGTAKKWVYGGLKKKAELLEAMALTPALYDVDPAVADRLLVDAVEESFQE